MTVKPSNWYENRDGVHYVGIDGEHMLCGDAFDGQYADYRTGRGEEIEEMHPTNKRAVTCPECIALLKHVKGVKFKSVPPSPSERTR